MKVLVIEDDPGIIEVVSLCFQLRWSGTTVVSASSGNKGLELVETESPDVVILDIGLPVFNGFETCALLRGDPEVPAELAVVLLTDEALEPHRVEKVRATRVFAKTHLGQSLRDLLVAYLDPKALP